MSILYYKNAMPGTGKAALDLNFLAANIKQWGESLGFQRIGIADIELGEAEGHLQDWLRADLVPGTVRVISARMDYWPEPADDPWRVLADTSLGYISRYALGRDYHKVLRKRLQRLAQRIETAIGPFGYRVFTDSAPVLEKALAEKAGLGWIGKHTNLLARDTGSWFFLGEIYTDLPLPPDRALSRHCGTCTACIDICPTRAIVAPYQLDARRCISYLTIELRGPIPEPLRPLIGNRIYGCDDCQLICPWNRYARPTAEKDFHPRHGLAAPQLLQLFAWSEEEFLARTEGSPIRRIGYLCWLRNIAVALGNANPSPAIMHALKSRADHPSSLVREHIAWAIKEQERKKADDVRTNSTRRES